MTDPRTKLKDNELRLIYLNYSEHQSTDGPLVCNCQNFEFDRVPKFFALSYTCGLPYLQHHQEQQRIVLGNDDEVYAVTGNYIVCDGFTIKISSNLHNALLGIRQNLGDGIWIWIDALSISQDDLVERAYQVQRMDRIYANAENVMIWLGPPLPRCPYDILQFLDDFGKASEKLVDLSVGNTKCDYKYEGNKLFDTSWHDTLGIDNFLDKIGWTALFWSLYRWSSRSWVLQEAALAKRATLLCGAHTLDLSVLSCFITSVEILDWPAAIGKLLVQNFDLWAPTWWPNLLMIRTSIKFEKVPMILDPSTDSDDVEMALIRSYLLFNQLLFFARNRDCFDSRDKIYALLGLAYRKIDPLLISVCRVDYAKEVEDLYIEVAMELLMKTRKLELLAYTGRSLRVSNPKLPSWVPDFRLGMLNRPALAICRVTKKPIYNASCGQLVSNKALFVDGTVLHCQRHCFDSVKTSYTAFPNDQMSRSKLSFDVIVKVLRDMAKSVGCHSTLEALWGTLILGPPGPLLTGLKEYEYMDLGFVVWTIKLLVQEGITGKQRLDHIRDQALSLESAFSPFLLKHNSEIGNIITEVTNLVNACNDTTELIGQWKHFEQRYQKRARLYEERFSSTWGTRNLVRTDRGLLASTQAPLELGDEIWILAGTRTPFALRKETDAIDEYSLQGDCFILDHVFGEIFDDDKYGLLDRLQRIKIV